LPRAGPITLIGVSALRAINHKRGCDE